jgi:hypothetical protein
MRRTSIMLASIVLMHLVLFVSCEPTEESEPAGAGESTTAQPATPTGVPAVCLYDGAYFVQGDVDENGVLSETSHDTLDLGEALQYLDESVTWESGGRELEMLKVLRDDEVGYAYVNYIAIDAVPGALTSEAHVYSEGEDAGVTTRRLPVLQIVAVYNEEFDDNLVKVGFTPLIPVDDYRDSIIYTVYVKRIRLTTQPNDVKVAYLYYLSTRTDDEELRATRLEISLETRSTFSDVIQAELDELNGVEDSEAGPESMADPDAQPESDVDADASVVDVAPEPTGKADDQATGGIPDNYGVDYSVENAVAVVNTRSNLRSEPSTSADSLYLLEPGTTGSVMARTVEQETIQGETDHWYAVNFGEMDGELVQGWIFGSLLDIELK